MQDGVADARYMARAIASARRPSLDPSPNPRVGACLVQDGVVVAEGAHWRAGEPHAEVHALREAGLRARGATCYVTLEPCAHTGRTPPCAEALIAAGVARVVVAMEDPNPLVAGRGLARLREAGVSVTVGVLSDAAAALNPGFLQRMRIGRPWVRVKLAASLDGRTALAGGESQWISSEAARRDVHRWRARSDAIMTGVGTVLADDPRLTVRPDPGRQPLRVVLDRQLRTPAVAALATCPGETVIFAGEGASGPIEDVPGVTVERVGLTGTRLSLPHVLGRLAARGVNTVWVEAGATLAGAFIEAGLADELLVYLAPIALGLPARGLLALPVFTALGEAPRFVLAESRRVGPDLRLTWRPVRSRAEMA